MTGNGNGQTQTATMNEATMQTALHDLLKCANLGPKQGMDSTVDHTGTHPVLVKAGGIAHTTQAGAFAALQRYLVNVKAEWAWAAGNEKNPGGLGFDEMTPASATQLLAINYPVGGANARTVGALAYGLMKVKRTQGYAAKAVKNAAALAEAAANGGHFFAEGVVNKEGTAIPYATEVKARKAWARTHIGPKWWESNKADNLALAVTQRGAPFTEVSEATEKVRAVQAPTTTVTTPAPSSTGTVFTGESAVVPTPETVTTTPETVTTTTTATVGITDETIIGMAQGIGSQAKTVEGARAFLSSRGITV